MFLYEPQKTESGPCDSGQACQRAADEPDFPIIYIVQNWNSDIFIL